MLKLKQIHHGRNATNGIYIFTSFEKERTCAIIKSTILTIGGDFWDRSDCCFVAKWRAPKFHTILPTKFTFYVGDGLVRAVGRAADMQTITTRLKLWGMLYVWDHFVSNLLRLYPTTDCERKNK